MGLPLTMDTKNSAAIGSLVQEAFNNIGAQNSAPLITRLFSDVTAMFAGRYPGYQASDLLYHDYEHTLQVTVCLIKLLEGYHKTGDQPLLTIRDWELALMAVLLHDSGYLKTTNDRIGTGAKYTRTHELRGADFARNYLPDLGVMPSEIDDICSAIICTEPQSKLGQNTFHREEARLLASCLVTADYLAQMSAADYLNKLPMLFLEFQEAYDFERVAPADRNYRQLDELFAGTPGFWENYVRPLLDRDARGVHRYLTTAGQPNLYLQAVEANIAEVRRRLQLSAGRK
jgi:hypothetical protein